jgi:hypothetical protein
MPQEQSQSTQEQTTPTQENQTQQSEPTPPPESDTTVYERSGFGGEYFVG